MYIHIYITIHTIHIMCRLISVLSISDALIWNFAINPITDCCIEIICQYQY